MIFKTIQEARVWFLKYKPLEDKVISFWYDYSKLREWKFGDWILFQHITYEDSYIAQSKQGMISRPILAVFTNYKVWDQALVMNYVQPIRAWMYSHEVLNAPDSKYSELIGHNDDEVEAIQFWTDNIKVLGHWKHKPSIKELKEALK